MYITYAILGGVSPDQPKLDTTYCSHIRFNMFFHSSLCEAWDPCARKSRSLASYMSFFVYISKKRRNTPPFSRYLRVDPKRSTKTGRSKHGKVKITQMKRTKYPGTNFEPESYGNRQCYRPSVFRVYGLMRSRRLTKWNITRNKGYCTRLVPFPRFFPFKRNLNINHSYFHADHIGFY